MSTTKHSTESDYEMAYRSTIQPRTAVRTQSRQSGGYSTGAVSGGGASIFFGFTCLVEYILIQTEFFH
ncbi:unnamed protein product [Gongylonema pulchrum]|uniref:ERGIC_N domain-containing protein n=1 Tax=Gongylonema pulchrum TaxID=637853 RepID=A0A183EKE7_9BILA|nr:unnamed protein product [Gongylonema pulchrum]